MARGGRHVALIYDATVAYDLKVMAGVAAYLQENADWSVYVEECALKDQRLPDLRSWKVDGILADFDDPSVARAVVESHLPAVAFGSGYGWYAPESRIPYFLTNNRAVARLAADHLLTRGFRHFAYCGYRQSRTNGWSREREHAFVGLLKERGFGCHVHRGHFTRSYDWAALQGSLCKWLKALPTPLGVMAANDRRARQVLEACRAAGLRVPEQVAVIGVDNDELLCRLSSPLLSSIEVGAARIGYEAAASLDRIMSGGRPRRQGLVVDPIRVVARRSTDILAVEDGRVASALAFIKEHACDGIQVGDVVNDVGISRSGLEAHFRSALGFSVREAIRQVQMERAEQLISAARHSLKQVAANVGFKSVQHLTSLFRRAYGHPPARYRQMVASGLPAVSEASASGTINAL